MARKTCIWRVMVGDGWNVVEDVTARELRITGGCLVFGDPTENYAYPMWTLMGEGFTVRRAFPPSRWNDVMLLDEEEEEEE